MPAWNCAFPEHPKAEAKQDKDDSQAVADAVEEVAGGVGLRDLGRRLVEDDGRHLVMKLTVYSSMQSPRKPQRPGFESSQS